MSALLDSALRVSKRTYPPGYGFALAYLDDRLNPAHLRDGAFKVVEDAFAGAECMAPLRKDSDLSDFVVAYERAKSFEDFAIEAAQLVQKAAICGHENSRNVMRLCGHPGY